MTHLFSDKRIYFPVFLACSSLFALGWMDNARGPFFPMFLIETGESAARGSLFFALASFTAVVSSAVSGPYIKKMGLKSLLSVGGAFMFFSPFPFFGYASLTGALLSAFLFGWSLGFVAVGQNVLIGEIEDSKIRQRLFSLLHCFYALAAMSAPLSMVVLKDSLPWNWCLVGVSFLLLPFLLGLLFYKRKELSTSDQNHSELKSPPFFEKESFFWIFFMSFYVASELIMTTRLVVLSESYQLSFNEASQNLFFYFLSMFLSRVLFFVFHFKVQIIRILLGFLFIAFLIFVFSYSTSQVFLFSLTGFFMGPIFPLVMEMISKNWKEHFDLIVSRVIALSSLFVVLSHIAVGEVTDVYGIQTSILIVPIFLFLAFSLLMLKLWRGKAS